MVLGYESRYLCSSEQVNIFKFLNLSGNDLDLTTQRSLGVLLDLVPCTLSNIAETFDN